MERFDFLILLPAIATGLAISKLIQFFGELLSYRPEQLPSPLHFFWLLCLFVLIVQHWYFMLDWRREGSISTFLHYALSFLFPVGIFLMAVILCPSSQEPGFKVLAAHFTNQAQIFYVVAGSSMLAVALEGRIIEIGNGIGLAYPSENIVRSAVGVLFFVLAFLPISISNLAGVALLLISVGFRVAMQKWPI